MFRHGLQPQYVFAYSQNETQKSAGFGTLTCYTDPLLYMQRFGVKLSSVLEYQRSLMANFCIY